MRILALSLFLATVVVAQGLDNTPRDQRWQTVGSGSTLPATCRSGRDVWIMPDGSYRYCQTGAWVNPFNGASNVPMASSSQDGLLSHGDYTTLHSLGSAATANSSSFDPAGAAASAQSSAVAAAQASSVQNSAFGASQQLSITSAGAPFVNPSDPAMNVIRTALGNASAQVVNVCLVGDSVTAGVDTTALSKSWAGVLQTYLQQNYGNHGSGVIQIRNGQGNWTIGGSWTQMNAYGPYQTGSYNPFSSVYQASGTGNTLALNSIKYLGDTAVIYYVSYTDSGAGFSVSVDGGAATTYGAVTTSTYTMQTVSVPLGGLGWHTLQITAPATGNAYIYGAEFTVGTTGVSVQNFGASGSTAAAWSTAPATQLGWLTKVPGGCQLVTVEFKINDSATNTPLSAYGTNLSNLIAWLKANVSPAPSVLVLDAEDTLGTNTNGISLNGASYKGVEQTVAVQNGAAYVSVQDRWGLVTQAAALGLMYTDNVHPSTLGYSNIGQMVISRVIERAPPVTNDTGSQTTTLGSVQFQSGYNPIESVLIGQNTAPNATTLKWDTAVGYSACKALTTGTSNACFGMNAGNAGPTVGTQDVLLGANANVGTSTSSAIQIGNGTNSTSNTAQFWSWNLLDNSGNLNANLIKRSVGAVIASASTISPASSIVHVTGTGVISTITVPSITVGGGSFTGCLVLIPDGAWTTTTSGNIALATAAVVNKRLEVCYDGSKWYPSY